MKFLKIWQRSYSLLAFLAFNLSEKFARQGFSSAKKHKNAKNEKTTFTTPTFSDFKSFFLPDSTRFEDIRKFYRRKLKSKPNRREKWRCLSSFNLRLKALISEVTVEQQILALVCSQHEILNLRIFNSCVKNRKYKASSFEKEIAKRTRILTFD